MDKKETGELIIVSWGAPWKYKKKKYSLENGESISSCSSFFSIAKKYPDSDIIIVGSDSILDFSIGKDERNECSEAFNKAADKLNIKPISASLESYRSYDEILNRAEELIKRTAINMKPEDLDEERIKTVAVPMLGKMGNVLFTGGSRDPLSIMLYKLYMHTKSKDVNRIILDLTHGINYIPSILLQASRFIASLSLLRSIKGRYSSVEIKAYNSEVLSEERGEMVLREVYAENLESIMLPALKEGTGDLKLITWRGKEEPPKEFKGFNEEIGKLYGNLKNILASVFYPAPLVLKTSCLNFKDPKLIEDALDRAFDLWKKLTDIVNIKDLKVVRNSELSYWTIYSYLLAKEACEWIGFEKDSMSAEELKKSSELYKRINKSYEYLILNEVSKLETDEVKKKLIENKKEGCFLYSEVLERERKMSKSREPDMRILIAHAGLQSDLTQLCIEPESKEIVVKYDEEVYGKIVKQLKSSFTSF